MALKKAGCAECSPFVAASHPLLLSRTHSGTSTSPPACCQHAAGPHGPRIANPRLVPHAAAPRSRHATRLHCERKAPFSRSATVWLRATPRDALSPNDGASFRARTLVTLSCLPLPLPLPAPSAQRPPPHARPSSRPSARRANVCRLHRTRSITFSCERGWGGWNGERADEITGMAAMRLAGEAIDGREGRRGAAWVRVRLHLHPEVLCHWATRTSTACRGTQDPDKIYWFK